MRHAGLILFLASVLSACGGEDSGDVIISNEPAAVLVDSNPEPVGPNCAYGGIRLSVGLDSNENGSLEENEITDVNYQCNGLAAKVLMDSGPEAEGPNCAYGGTKFSVGLDSNENGSLEESEITDVSYQCNGLAAKTLLESVSEPAGDNCTFGGSKISVGLDANANDMLEESEITDVTYHCLGAIPGNNPPVITAPASLEMSYSNSFNVVAGVSDPDGNPILVTWTVASTPVDGVMDIMIAGSQESVWITANKTGIYVLRVLAFDGLQLSSKDIDVTVTNAAPQYLSFTILPSSPDSSDNIVANLAGVSDPDGDAVTANYVWSLNGGASFQTSLDHLTPAQTEKGMLVEVYAELADGENTTTTATESVTVGNSLPEYTSFDFASTDVNATTDIGVSLAGLSDYDGDSLSVTYVWTVDDVVVGDVSGSVLPAGRAVKDQVVRVSASIDDGEDAIVTDTISLTVGSAPISYEIVGLPNSASSGVELNFSVTAYSPDTAEYLPPILAYGPDGMNIDVDGNVTWTPNEIMFLKEETFHFGVAVAGEEDSPHAASVKVVDSGRQLPLARSGIEVPKKNHSIWIGDFDDDAVQEILLTDSRNLVITLEYDGTSYVQDWMYPFWYESSGAIVQVIGKDIDGDNKPEIIVVTADYVSVISDLEKPADILFESNSNILAAAVDDIDGDGAAEIALLYSNSVSVYRIDGWIEEFSQTISGTATSVVIGNVDNDVAAEVIVNTGYVFDGLTGANQWYFSSGFGSLLAVGDVNADGIDEIVGSGSWAAPIVYSAVAKSELWNSPYDNICSLNVKNIDADAQEELLVGECQWGDVIAYDGSTGAAVVQAVWDTVEHASISVTAGDVDGDNNIEVVWGSGITSSGEDVLVIGEQAATPYTFHNTDPSQLDWFTAAGWVDVEPGVGAAVFLAPRTDSGYSGQRYITMDLDGNTVLSDIVDSNWDNAKYSLAVDYDKDGYAELFLATSATYNGRFQVVQVNDGAVEWGGSGGVYDDQIGVVEAYLVNDDAYEDAIYVNARKVVAIDVLNEVLIWESVPFSSNIYDVAAFGDSEGYAKIVVATSSEVSIWGRSGGQYLRESTYSTGCERVQVDEAGGKIYCLRYHSSPSATTSSFIVLNLNLNLLYQFPWSERVLDFTLEQPGSGSTNLLISSYQGSSMSSINPFANGSISLISSDGKLIWQSPNTIGLVPHRGLFYLPEMMNENKRVTFATSDAIYISR